MDRYRIAPARPVCLSSAAAAGTGAHLRSAPPGRRYGGAEIGIFTAERYFSAADVIRRDAAVIVPAAPTLADDHELSVPAADVASQSGRRTAASSEASWNSRSGLLSAGAHPPGPPRRAVPVVYDQGQGYHRGRKTTGGYSGQRWTLCPCAGKKAVTVDVASSEPPRSPMAMAAAQHLSAARFSPQSAVDECLESDIFKKANQNHPSSPPMATPPADQSHQELPAKEVKITVTPGTGSRAFPLATSNIAFAAAPNRSMEIDRRVVTSAGFTFPAALGALDELPRLSLEVFRPIDQDTVMVGNPPRAMPFARAPAAAVAEEEAMSDASSDLFDLESFAASSSYPTTYRGRGSHRNSADDDDNLPYVSAAEPAVSECMYPASEASVVWSVVTAEGGAFDAASMANFSSAASACCVDDEYLRFYMGPDTEESPEAAAGDFTVAMSRTAGRKKSGGGGGGFLNSCRCEKAVSVGPTPVRVVRLPAHPGAAASRKKKGGDDGAARYHPGAPPWPCRSGRDAPSTTN